MPKKWWSVLKWWLVPTTTDRPVWAPPYVTVYGPPFNSSFVHVHSFLFSPSDVGREDGTETTDIVLKRLSELVQVVQTCLGQHSGMQSTEIKNAAMTLMQTYQGTNLLC